MLAVSRLGRQTAPHSVLQRAARPSGRPDCQGHTAHATSELPEEPVEAAYPFIITQCTAIKYPGIEVSLVMMQSSCLNF